MMWMDLIANVLTKAVHAGELARFPRESPSTNSGSSINKLMVVVAESDEALASA